MNSTLFFTNSDNNTHTIVADESFRISVGPNTKSLTLLDLDNRLLIDTNFDGIEPGVTSFTANEFLFNTTRFEPKFFIQCRVVTEVNIVHLNESILSTYLDLKFFKRSSNRYRW